jgi:hypothetical protein
MRVLVIEDDLATAAHIRDYEEQRRHGVEPRFDKRPFPENASRLDDDVW